jgi:hypothetical protein
MSRLALLIIAVAAGLVAGCAAIHRPPATIASLSAGATGVRLAESVATDSVVTRLSRRVAARGDHQLDILLLSGGGQDGAYGAGFLRGWTGAPAFDLVSGISTGALQAPFALLGTSSALDTLGVLYRNARTRIGLKLDLLFLLRPTGGVLSTSKYRKELARVLDPAMADSLQQRFAQDRQLLIGTTDFDLGMRRTWSIADQIREPDGLARVRNLLVASTAIPAVFPPVILDGHVHADGGVISNVMPGLEFNDYRQLADRANATAAAPVTVHLWVIMNLFLAPSPHLTRPSSRHDMDERSKALLFQGQQAQLVERLRDLARAVNGEIPGMRMELRVTAIPGVLHSYPGASSFFDTGWMKRLDQYGFDRAHSLEPWDVVLPP